MMKIVLVLLFLLLGGCGFVTRDPICADGCPLTLPDCEKTKVNSEGKAYHPYCFTEPKKSTTQTEGKTQTEGTTQNGPNNPATKKSNTYQSPPLPGRHPEVSTPAVKCNINNYKEFIKKPGVHNCNLRGADLRQANLRSAKLQRKAIGTIKWANLDGADLDGAIVTAKQAKLLEIQGYKGFVVVE